MYKQHFENKKKIRYVHIISVLTCYFCLWVGMRPWCMTVKSHRSDIINTWILTIYQAYFASGATGIVP